MSQFTMDAVVDGSFADVLRATRNALTDAGFGVLTEIDVRQTLHDKLGVEVPSQVILGACRPELAHRALTADQSLAAVLPCNVVVRAAGEGTTEVEVIDPEAMLELSANPDLADIAAEARRRLATALASLIAPAPVH